MLVREDREGAAPEELGGPIRVGHVLEEDARRAREVGLAAAGGVAREHDVAAVVRDDGVALGVLVEEVQVEQDVPGGPEATERDGGAALDVDHVPEEAVGLGVHHRVQQIVALGRPEEGEAVRYAEGAGLAGLDMDQLDALVGAAFAAGRCRDRHPGGAVGRGDHREEAAAGEQGGGVAAVHVAHDDLGAAVVRAEGRRAGRSVAELP
jgi:hypothetical protein